MPQTEQQKIRSRLRSYERKLQQEKKKFGWYSDGGGKRYQVAPHYMLLGDNEGALTAFAWFEREFDRLPGCRICRPEVWHEMRTAARLFAGGEAESMEDAAWSARERTRRRGKKHPRAVVSRTLLVKSMEFDHGLTVDAGQLSDRENFYVAVTRASHSLTIISDNPVISFANG